MNKKVMALAVAGVLTAPAAFAQSSNVQLYGRVNLGLDNYEAIGARNQTIGGLAVSGEQIGYKARTRVFDNSSRVGVRGTEDLGNGLKAIFQIETGVAVDSGQAQGSGGVSNGSKGTWASRDSFVGLDSGWGRLTFGRQSIYWANGELAQFAANYINTEIPWTNGTNLGRVSRNAGGAFVSIARQSNTVQYTSPRFAGINATVSYSPNAQENVQHNTCVPAINTTTNVQFTGQQAGQSGLATTTASNITTTGTACAVGTGSNTDGNVWGATLRGAWGAFHGQVDYVQSQGNTPLTSQFGGGPTNLTQAEFKAWKAGVGWKYMPGANLSVIWVSNENNAAQGTPLGNVVKQQGWTINWEHTFGNIQAMAQFGWTQDMKGCAFNAAISCSDTAAQAYMIGARYLLSKRTWIYASYNSIDNEQNNFSDYTGDSYTSVVPSGNLATPYGADPQVWAFGIFHAF
jgi:predicted porin